jgi:hypothetical protein
VAASNLVLKQSSDAARTFSVCTFLVEGPANAGACARCLPDKRVGVEGTIVLDQHLPDKGVGVE